VRKAKASSVHVWQSARRLERLLAFFFYDNQTNDSISFARATIGIHKSMGKSTAKMAPVVVLASPYLGVIFFLRELYRLAFDMIVLNFVWSLLYIVFAILPAARAFKSIPVRVQPQYYMIEELLSIVAGTLDMCLLVENEEHLSLHQTGNRASL
jgi:hypothetical protein